MIENKKIKIHIKNNHGSSGTFPCDLEGEKNFTITYALTSLSILFLVTTLLKADLLLPLNKLWMRIGLLLGMIISPIVLGLIFFGMFVPTNLIMRISGRDELHLRFKKKHSHWIIRKIQPTKSEKFKYQF